jgi:hypothetical protein
MPKYKLDDQGNYLPFPGYTVICKLNLEEEFDGWFNIYNTLIHDKNITDFYSILPLSSWHVTAINLFTQEAVEHRHVEWGGYVASKQKFFDQLSQVLQQRQITPTLTYADLYTNGALQVDVALDKQSIDWIHALAKYYKYERNVPSHFHVTLGYQYNNALNSTQAKALKSELAPRIQTYLSEISHRLLQLQPAQLCYFEDMLAFTPLEPRSCSSSRAASISMFAPKARVTPVDDACKPLESPKQT